MVLKKSQSQIIHYDFGQMLAVLVCGLEHINNFVDAKDLLISSQLDHP